ncbi:hypothetical protein COT42_02260 [Candidatus Saganbacteria bacterium CG08_land_8_20_14_0_20_45_16]|uniref:Uncharacterized protein n=1 Tax=Candidatus Saganbacteria bacterium CG08_land_8_20_14_0_20_45_16 TaxID=2014293 RepID=A0A2H0Y2J4_UNCSA|nr:MAG: hypothetical protein COT42_02260 [Candidatus Saganbacteria bacterium CG08_land_8_20_14_0_20_45_16]
MFERFSQLSALPNEKRLNIHYVLGDPDASVDPENHDILLRGLSQLSTTPLKNGGSVCWFDAAIISFVIGHELAHINLKPANRLFQFLDRALIHLGPFRRRAEKQADLLSVIYMVKLGYIKAGSKISDFYPYNPIVDKQTASLPLEYFIYRVSQEVPWLEAFLRVVASPLTKPVWWLTCSHPKREARIDQLQSYLPEILRQVKAEYKGESFETLVTIWQKQYSTCTTFQS